MTLNLLHSTAHFLLNPLTLFWLLLLLGLISYWRGSKRSPWLIGGALGWLFLISTSPLPTYLAAQREARHPVLWSVPDSLPAPRILVLGGGHTNAPSLPPNDQLSLHALSRLAEGIRLYRGSPGARLVGSGYSATARSPQGEVLMNAAVALGVPPADTLILPTPANTEQEAYAYARRFGTEDPVVIVTSALHIPRALFWFKRAGLKAVPAPANHYVKPDPERSPYNLKPSAQKIELSGKLLHEWAGMGYGKVKR